MDKNTFVYFLYSKTQYNLRSDIEKGRSGKYKPGTVHTKMDGYVPYTEMCLKDSNSFTDAKVVAKGILKDMKYTE